MNPFFKEFLNKKEKKKDYLVPNKKEIALFSKLCVAYETGTKEDQARLEYAGFTKKFKNNPEMGLLQGIYHKYLEICESDNIYNNKSVQYALQGRGYGMGSRHYHLTSYYYVAGRGYKSREEFLAKNTLLFKELEEW